jgi:hypothetical protein
MFIMFALSQIWATNPTEVSRKIYDVAVTLNRTYTRQSALTLTNMEEGHNSFFG